MNSVASKRMGLIVIAIACSMYAYGDGKWFHLALRDSMATFYVALIVLCAPISYAISIRPFAYELLAGEGPWWNRRGAVAFLLCVLLGVSALEVTLLVPLVDEFPWGAPLSVSRRYSMVCACLVLAVLLLDWNGPETEGSVAASLWARLTNPTRSDNPTLIAPPPPQFTINPDAMASVDGEGVTQSMDERAKLVQDWKEVRSFVDEWVENWPCVRNDEDPFR